MIKLFDQEKNKNLVLLVDPTHDSYFETKKNICCEIFDCLEPEDNISLISMAKKVKRIFSLVPKIKNTIQLFNQLDGLESHNLKKVEIFGGVIKSINEISDYKNDRNSNFNWIICIISNPKFKKSISEEDYIQIEKDLACLQINLLIISVGDFENSDSKRLKKCLDFNDSTMFLNLVNSIKNPPSSKKQATMKKQKVRFYKTINPDISKIRALMANISSIKTIDENLIYEKF